MNKTICVIFNPLRSPPCGRICTEFGTALGVADIVTCDKFLGDWLKGVGSVRGGSKITICH